MIQRGGWTRIPILILLAVACAAVSNFAASRERKLAWAGSYPRALEITADSTVPRGTGAAEPAATSPATTSPAGPEKGAAEPPPVVTQPAGTAGSVAPAPSTVSAAAHGLARSAVPTAAPPEAAKAGPSSSASRSFPPHPDRASVEISTDDAELLL